MKLFNFYKFIRADNKVVYIYPYKKIDDDMIFTIDLVYDGFYDDNFINGNVRFNVDEYISVEAPHSVKLCHKMLIYIFEGSLR